jgi:hypothetical protein
LRIACKVTSRNKFQCPRNSVTEAMMDLRPWDQWAPDGHPQPGTEEILATLDAVLKIDVKHPLANHLYIHAVEASPHPELADAAGPDHRLRGA